MMTLPEGAAMATNWSPTTFGGYILVVLLLLAVSWWLTGRIFRERDRTTLVFRGVLSLLVCFGIGLFHQSLVQVVRQGPLAAMVKMQAEKDARLQANMQQWVAAPAYDACWRPGATDPRTLKQMTPMEREEFEASQVTPAILAESAVRGLTWMALKHRHPSPSGSNALPHAERGTKVLNNFTVVQAQAMFDYVLLVSPQSEGEARPYLEDACAFCREAAAPATRGIAVGGSVAKPDVGPYPFVEASRETSRGRMFVIRLSATQRKLIAAGSEEEALRIAKQP